VHKIHVLFCSQDGAPLDKQAMMAAGVSVEEWLSQTMHPVLQVPFWFLHPCGTESALGAMGDLSPPANALLAWLGVLEQVFISPLMKQLAC